jgi:hypothetical protein
MNQDDFIEEVKAFQSMYCGEYMDKHIVVFDFENETLSAVIECEDFGGHKWHIPICLGYSGEIGIDIGDAGTLNLNGEGFYCYLWHESIK